MFKNIRKIIAGTLTAATLLVVPVLATPALASAQSTPASDTGNCAAQGSNYDLSNIGSTCSGTNTTQGSADSLTNLVKTIINIFSVIVGIVSVVMIILGGLRYITSGGDSNNVSGAKNTIIYAIIGLVVVALAQFIVQFVLSKLGNGS